MNLEMEFTQSEDLDIEFEEEGKMFDNAFEELYLSGSLKSPYEYAVDGGYTGTEEEFVAELLCLTGLKNNIQKQLDAKAEKNDVTKELNKKANDYSIELYNGTGGNPKAVRFASFNYSTCASEEGIAAKIGMVSGHGNGLSYAFLQDAIFRVNYLGDVEVDNFKYYGQETATYADKKRQYGDIFWLHDTTNKIVDFYCLMGQYARLNMTPWKRLTYSSKGTVAQHTNCTVFTGSTANIDGWANNSEIATLNDVPTTKETWTFTLEDGSVVSKVVYVE